MDKHELRIYFNMKIKDAKERMTYISEHKIGPDEYDELVRLMERKDTLEEIFKLLKRNDVI